MKNTCSRIAPVLLMMWLIPAAGGVSMVFGQPASGPWTLEDCLLYGLTNHPSVKQAQGAVESARANLGLSRSGLGTKLNVQGSFSRRRTEYSRAAANARVPGASDDLIDSTGESLSARKIITDFGQTAARLQALAKDLQSTGTDQVWVEVQLAAQIKSALLQALKARSLLAVQQENLRSFQEHLQKVKGFVEVGSRPPYDITKAEVDVANGQVSLIGAESDCRNTLSQLRKAVGFDGDLIIGEPLIGSLPPLLELDSEKLMAEALRRPDLHSARLQTDSARFRETQARRGLAPTLSGSADYSWNGTVTPLDRGWSMGLSLTAPLLDGQQTRFSIDQARSSVQISQARLEQLVLAVRTDLETAITGVIDARKRFEATSVLLRQASETLNLAQGRYEAGVGSAIERTDARNGYTSAEGSHYAAYFDTLIALANLDRALGRFPPEMSAWSPAAGPARPEKGTDR